MSELYWSPIRVIKQLKLTETWAVTRQTGWIVLHINDSTFVSRKESLYMLEYAKLLACKVLNVESLSCTYLRRCKTSTDVGSGCLLVIKNFLSKYSFCVLEATAVLLRTVRRFIKIYTYFQWIRYIQIYFFFTFTKNPTIIKQYFSH